MNRDETVEQDVSQALREHAFLRGVSDEHVRELARIAKFVDFPKGATIFRDQDPALNCYLIVDGIVSLEICAPATGCATILTLGKGELMGWSPLVGRERLTANARTLSATRMIEMKSQDLLAFCEKVPEFGYRFMRCTALALAKRLTATRLQLLDLYRAEAPDRPIQAEEQR